ncbi:YrdB family protein [Glycomyces tenuis]|uniref:YrdB family protein n=1 Tax=Glycomyces tenuis TaxID=58116 RepID=UPI000423E97A|nr:YrdB family protein [Glycomyces tenuis]
MSERDDPGRTAAPFEPEWAKFTGASRVLVMCNSLLALVLELALFAFVIWWALSLDVSLWPRVLIAVAAVLALGLLWGRYAAPRAPVRLPTAGVLAVKAVAFGAGVAALWGVGYPTAAVAFAILVVANTSVVTFARAMPSAT